MTLPTFFISHGAPDLPIRTGPTQDFLRQLLASLPEQPTAMLVISAHWLTAQPTLSTNPQPQTIYDFGGFPPHLSELVYRAPGSPTLAKRVAELLAEAGFAPQFNSDRGYDHGAWTPLILMNPAGQIPVTLLSLQPQETPAHHLHLGKALACLRDEGVLIIGSGAATHNMAAFNSDYHAAPPAWAIEFDTWLAKAIDQNDLAALLNYRQVAPHAERNHPTDEHLLPLFVALGAGGQGHQVNQGFTYGAFSMAAYQFDGCWMDS
ncbi:MAG: dioxygenase [Synechococcales cyanobacterium K44_A2020_017]|nr:dioxygenase [Synechococcales cyanobacterium K32_A2020_035]MBF2095350.1 dioxygenase [Synechococcales cyanobacterium K44_A2020_017]